MLFSALFTGVVLYASSILIVAVTEGIQEYRKESECVERFIQRGIERRDIYTADGNCWIQDKVNTDE